MEFDKYQFTTHHGITFCVSRFTVMPADRGGLRTLYFREAKAANFEVTRLLVWLYDKMLARDLPCVMSVGISNPLTRSQGDWLNEQRMDLLTFTTGIFTGVAGQVPGIGKVVAPAAGYLGRRWAKDLLPTLSHWRCNRQPGRSSQRRYRATALNFVHHHSIPRKHKL